MNLYDIFVALYALESKSDDLRLPAGLSYFRAGLRGQAFLRDGKRRPRRSLGYRAWECSRRPQTGYSPKTLLHRPFGFLLGVALPETITLKQLVDWEDQLHLGLRDGSEHILEHQRPRKDAAGYIGERAAIIAAATKVMQPLGIMLP